MGRKVVLVPLASRVLSVQQENEVFLACLAHLALLAAKENGATVENLAVKESEVKRVPKARLVYLVLLVPSAPPATMELPALTGSLDLLAFLAAPETKVPRDPLDNRAALAQLVCLVLLALQDPLVPPESAENEESLVPRVWRVLVVPEESQEHQALQARREKRATLALREPRAIAV